MFDLSFWRDDVLIRNQNPQFCNNRRAHPKKLMEVTLFCFGGLNSSTRLVLDVLFYLKKISGRQVGHPFLFGFFLVHVKVGVGGGARAGGERRVQGIMISKEREWCKGGGGQERMGESHLKEDVASRYRGID